MTSATYWRGFAIEYTGESEVLYGRVAYAAVILDGHRKGETVWIYKAPLATAKKVGAPC